IFFFFFSSRRRHTRSLRDWSSDVCSSDLLPETDHFLDLAFAVQARLEVIDVELDAERGEVGVLFLAQVGDRVLADCPEIVGVARSEERRVGKEGRCRGAAEPGKERVEKDE